MMTGFADIETAVESMKSGATDYISKPIEPELLFNKIEDAFKKQLSQKTNIRSFNEIIKPPGQKFDNLHKRLNEYAEKNQHFLIIGDRGTGKASSVKYAYQKGFNNLKPFVVLDVDQISNNSVNTPETKQMSVFTENLKIAKGGLLYIRKVHKLDMISQNELLTVLIKQKKDENYTQIIMSSEKDKGELKVLLLPKLYELLIKEYIALPTLKGKENEILFFTEYFLKLANNEMDKNIQQIESEVLEGFYNHSWPGNIQELKNTVYKAVLLTEGDKISANILPLLFRDYLPANNTHPNNDDNNVAGLRKENYEKEKIKEALDIAKGNKTMAASILNIDRKTLYNKIKLYGIEVN